MNIIPLCTSITLLHLKCCISKLFVRVGLIRDAKLLQYHRNYELCMSPTWSSEIQCFKCNNAIEIHNRIMFVFHRGPPHTYIYMYWIMGIVTHSLAWIRHKGCCSVATYTCISNVPLLSVMVIVAVETLKITNSSVVLIWRVKYSDPSEMTSSIMVNIM